MISAERIAAIDVGSNTILLTVAEYGADAGLIVIEEAEDQPRLSTRLSVTGRLGEESMGRALQTLSRMLATWRGHNVRRIAAVATAAVREAANGPEFVERVRALGIPLRIIPTEAEAALSYRSAAHRFPSSAPTIVADIGGGSLELTGADGREVRFSRSLPLGAVRMTEVKFSLPRLQEHIAGALNKAIPPTAWNDARVIGSGGTFATLASMALARRGGPPGHTVHGTIVERVEVEELLGALEKMSPEQRRQVPG